MTWLAMPLVPVAAAFAAGIALAPWTPSGAAWVVWGLTPAIGLALVARRDSRGALAAAAACLIIGWTALGTLRGTPPPLPADHVARLALPRIGQLDGRIVAEPTRYGPDRARVLVDVAQVDSLPRAGRVQLTLHGEAPELAEGYRVRVECRLYRAGGFRNPGVFDYGAHLARESIHVVASAAAHRLSVLAAPPPPWPARVKREAVAAIGRALPPDSAALLQGLLLGDRGELPRETDEAFRRAGVYHVLAVSGFNVALIGSAVFALFTLARAGRRLTAVAAILVVIGFALVVGPEPSVIRAVIMAVLVLLALLLEREASVMNSLALAALVILAVRPGDLADPGFQLSFAATLGIVLAPIPRGLVLGAVGVSLAAQLAVLPVTLTHFNQVSTIGVLANLVVVPLAGIATMIGLLGVALAFVFEAGARVAFDAVWPALILLRMSVALAASVPGAIVHLPAPGAPATLLYAGALAAAVLAWRRRGDRPRLARRAGLVALSLVPAAMIAGAWPLLRPADGRLRVTVLDVGQGDAIVLEAPDGRALLIDAGAGGARRLDAGERVVAPFLWNRGILRLAAAVVTHADVDHAGGMRAVRRLFGVDDDWSDDGRRPRWLGGAMISPLSPSARGEGGRLRATPRNDEGVVLRVDYGLASFLLTADIGAAAEEALLQARAPLAATVLKVAHHGSGTSSTPAFLAAVRPAIAVISVGARNPYGHPDAGTLARVAAAGARIYRTDRDGAVLFETDGRVLTVTRWASRRVERYCLDPETIC